MDNPFDRPPINVSQALLAGSVRRWTKDYLAAVSPATPDKTRLLESLRTGEDPTIRDGVNLALSHLLDPASPKDGSGRAAFLVHDGTGTGKSFQAILAAKAMAHETGEPALLITRANLLSPLQRDLDRLGLDSSQIEIVAIEELGPFLKEAQGQRQRFSVTIVDEAQDCRLPEVRRLLDKVPSGRLLFFSATPFHNINEFCYFNSKLTGRPIQEIKSELTSKPDLLAAVSDQIKQITAAGGMVQREFPFYGSVLPAGTIPLRAESQSVETQLIDGYARLIRGADLPRQAGLVRDLDSEMNTASDNTKVATIFERTLEALSQNKKVILFGDDVPTASRILRDADGLPKESAGFLSAMKAAIAAHGIECSFLRTFPDGSESVPVLARERAEIELTNAEQMALFVDGACKTNESGQRFEVRGPDNRPIYAPSLTKVILIPYSQAAGWPELNQRFSAAPEVSIILTPSANADQFMQAIGRGSRRNSQGPTDVQLVANDSRADCRRLSQLLRGLQFIAATGSPAVAPFVSLTADFLEKASSQRALRDQRLIQLQKSQRQRSARILDPNFLRLASRQPGVRQ
jgi:hypothetical protein